jgi:uncharacterized membrane protein YraQ (UPF0718 family)
VNTLMFLWSHSSSRVLQLLPWFLLAVVLGRLLQAVRLDVLTAGGLRRRNSTAIIGTTLFGSLTPFCACAIVPIIRSVLRAGVPVSVVMAFWISSPAMAPEEFGLTAKVFGAKIAIVRLAGAIVLGIAAALVARILEGRGLLKEPSREVAREQLTAGAAGAASSGRPDPFQAACSRAAETCPVGARLPERADAATRRALADALAAGRATVLAPGPVASGTAGAATLAEAGAEPGCCAAASSRRPGGGGTADPRTHAAAPGWLSTARQSLREIRPRAFVRGVGSDTWTLGRWMLAGILAEALVTRFVPPSAFGGLLGGHNLVLSVIIAGLLSVPLYLNGVSAIPIGAALLSLGLNPAALITFLLAGSITTIPALAGVRSVVTNRVFALYVATGIIGPMIIGLLAAPILG